MNRAVGGRWNRCCASVWEVRRPLSRRHERAAHSAAAAQFEALMSGSLRTRRYLAAPEKVSLNLRGHELSLEVGSIGPLADTVVRASYGSTTLLASVVSKWEQGGSFMPLQVEYRERASGAGSIPRTSSRKEAGSSDRETLAARVIDRTLRPLFPKGYFYDTQLIVSVQSFDEDCDPIPLAINAASAALHVSDIPWYGPAAAVRVGWRGGAGGWGSGAACSSGPAGEGAEGVGLLGPFLSPSAAELAAPGTSGLDLLYAGSDARTLMLEIGAEELPEAQAIAALRSAHAALPPLLELQRELRRRAGRRKRVVPLRLPSSALVESVHALLFNDAVRMYRQHHFRKADRGNAQRLLYARVAQELTPSLAPEDRAVVGSAVDVVIKRALRGLVLDGAAGQGWLAMTAAGEAGAPRPPPPLLLPPSPSSSTAVGASVAGPAPPLGAPTAPAPAPQYLLGDAAACRPDGRSTIDVRAIACTVDVLPAPVHGSSLFARGDTQVLCTATLGPLELAQTLRPASLGLEGLGAAPRRKPFFLHYDFPPYSTNETGKVGGPNRRMIGHGALAEKALLPLLPPVSYPPTDAAAATADEAAPPSSPAPAPAFPYAIRVTSEVSGSDGSSSMATVCGATMALLDAGVPLRAPAAGISVGLVSPPPPEHAAAPPVRVAPESQVPAESVPPRRRNCSAAAADGVEGDPYAPAPAAIATAGGDPGDEGAHSPAPPPDGYTAGARYVLLTDIFGLEDHAGDMDFKVAGTANGLTAAQLDIKPAGVPLEVLEAALWRARAARLHILARMAAVLPAARAKLKPSVPRVEQLAVSAESVGKLVGPGGSTVRRIQEATGARITIDSDASPAPLVSIYAPTAALVAAAKTLVTGALEDHRRVTGSLFAAVSAPGAPLLTVGTAVAVTVARVLEFGVILNQGAFELGWMHLSEFAPRRISRVTDVLEEGDEVTALVTDVDSRGRAKFSLRARCPPGEDTDVSRFIVKRAKREGARSGGGAAAAAPDGVAPSVVVGAAEAESGGGGGLAPQPPPQPLLPEQRAAMPPARAEKPAAPTSCEPASKGADASPQLPPSRSRQEGGRSANDVLHVQPQAAAPLVAASVDAPSPSPPSAAAAERGAGESAAAAAEGAAAPRAPAPTASAVVRKAAAGGLGGLPANVSASSGRGGAASSGRGATPAAPGGTTSASSDGAAEVWDPDATDVNGKQVFSAAMFRYLLPALMSIRGEGRYPAAATASDATTAAASASARSST